MNLLDGVTNRFVAQSQRILGDNLVGIYLHGSAAMGCFHEESSDIDLLVVVKTAIPAEIKYRYMEMAIKLHHLASKKGIEFSVVRQGVCRPFIYPTPFELHFSAAHSGWYERDPFGYVDKMNGTDKDLAAHFTIVYHRGKCLYGKEIRDVFEKVREEFYFDSIWNDIENAVEEIATNPTYFILNLCRVLAYKRDGLILSKQEGGFWGVKNVPGEYRHLIVQALDEYISDKQSEWDIGCAKRYAAYMIGQIGG